MSSRSKKLFARIFPLLLACLMLPAVTSTLSNAVAVPQTAAAADKVDINTATADQLKALTDRRRLLAEDYREPSLPD